MTTVAEKRAAGLTKEQAIEVLQAQAEYDRTKPHDAPPRSEGEGESESEFAHACYQ